METNTRIHEAPKIYKTKQKKKITIKRILLFLTCLSLLYLSLFLLVVPERPDIPFFEGKGPFIIADRGGASLAPENTVVAFEKARSLGTEMLMLDIQMSKDGQLVVIRDPGVERTTNGEGQVSEMTLDQLRQLDAGYTFQDIRGKYIYRNQGIRIPTLEEVFQQFGSMRLILDIKEADYSNHAYELEQTLWELIDKYDLHDRVLVHSYSEESKQRFNHYAQNSVALAASNQEITKFVFYHKLFLNRLYRSSSDLFQMQTHYTIFNLKDRRLINGAHKLNIPVFYGTVDDEQQMKELLLKGADGIITNRPDLLLRVINELEVSHEES